MSNVIDITKRLKDRKIAEVLAKDSGKLFCHPNDVHLFDWLPFGKVQTSTVMPEGKPYVIDIEALAAFLKPQPLILDFKA